MKYIVKTTAMALIGGLFTAGLVLAAETKAGNMTEGSEGQQSSSDGLQQSSSDGLQQPGTVGQQQPSAAGQQQPSAVGQHQASASAVQMDGKQIRELQSALNEKGYAVGTVDGVLGPKTTAAIRDFQRKEGLSATGRLDQQTLKALGIDVGQQEFMGVSPEFGEDKQSDQPEAKPVEPMEQSEQAPQQMDQQSTSPGSQETR